MKLEAFQCPVCLSTHFKVEGDTYICLSCGNVYTKHQVDSQMFIDLRIANSHRQFAEFSKAKVMYEEIIMKYPDEDLTPAYWGLLLCDQQTLLETDNNGQLFPSFYRVKDMPIEKTTAYKKFFDYIQKNSPERMPDYQERINVINNAREKAVLISQTTKPYDVFICFKKTQLNSDFVTKDYDLANEIYNDLAEKYKIFYSEKSLRGIKVREYEPNIFYGLYTAKVMLIICSKKEYLESHWMQNEWQRFLQLNKDRGLGNRCIIPIFTDAFTPDELPLELSHLQGIKYGISLMSNIEKELSSLINPVDKDAEQQKQIDQIMIQQKQLQEDWARQQKLTLDMYLDENKDYSKDNTLFPMESLLKLVKVNIEDLGNFDEAYDLIHRAQQIDAENYLTWYYKLLIDFKAQNMTALIMHENYKDSINYRLMMKYAKSPDAQNFVNSIDFSREKYLRDMADKVNEMLKALDNNPRPTPEDINAIKLLYESLDKEAKAFVENIKIIVPNALKKIRENKILDFNYMLGSIEKKDHPNYDDIIKIKENYANLSEDEQALTGNFKQVVVDASNRMKMGKVQLVQQALTELDNQDSPLREDIIKIEKKFNSLEDEYKKYVKNYSEIMSNAYDKKYKNDAKVLGEYFTKLPKEDTPNRDIYVKLENRYRALPKKYRMMITNVNLLDDYYDKLIISEGGVPEEIEEVPEKKEKNVQKNTEVTKKKKKFWLWN